jgi:16S rRNA (uracil1498-N3)-methyltransferase
VLSGAEGRHATTVRRLAPGERADLTDGVGTLAACVVKSARAGVLELSVLARHAQPAPDPRVVVVQAIPKGDRGELAVETMTEVGVDVIVPWQAARSIVRWDSPRAQKAVTRWRTTAREAAKQARRAWLVDVPPLESTPAVIARIDSVVKGGGVAVVLHEDSDRPIAGLVVPKHGDVVLVVGPEGGVTPDEVAAFEAVGAVVHRLGPTVLRTSTAGTVAAAIVLANSGRWS